MPPSTRSVFIGTAAAAFALRVDVDCIPPAIASTPYYALLLPQPLPRCFDLQKML